MENTSEVGQRNTGTVEEGVDEGVDIALGVHGFIAIGADSLSALVVTLNDLLQRAKRVEFRYIGPVYAADPESYGYEAVMEVWH